MPKLQYDDLLNIYKCISSNYTATQIALKLSVSASMVYRVIERNVETQKKSDWFHCDSCKKLLRFFFELV